jgi:hypothetical protein
VEAGGRGSFLLWCVRTLAPGSGRPGASSALSFFISLVKLQSRMVVCYSTNLAFVYQPIKDPFSNHESYRPCFARGVANPAIWVEALTNKSFSEKIQSAIHKLEIYNDMLLLLR